MQWTIRYCQHKCREWLKGNEDTEVSVCGRAYAYRQYAFWETLAFNADAAFSKVNKNDYISPINVT